VFDVAVAIATHLALFIIAGVPAALAVRNASDGWGALAAETLAFGLVLLTLGVTMYAWLGWLGAAMVVAVWAALLAHVIVRRTGLPRIAAPRGREWVLVGAWLAVVVVTVALRFRSVNFLPWVGDMGAYVNWANEFVRTGELFASWPPYFPSYLSISSALFGDQLTTAGLSVSGLVLVLIVGRVLVRLGVGRWISFGVAALLTVNLHAIWFSTFPGSESINAPIYILWLMCIIGAIKAQAKAVPVWLLLAGIVMLSLGLLRGTGPLLLIPLIATAVVATVVGAWKITAPRLWLVTGASIAGAFVSYWYGISEIPRYYIDTQVRDLVPSSVFAAIERVGFFSPTPLTAILLIVVAIAVTGGGWFVANRRSKGGVVTRTPYVLGVVLGVAILTGMLVDVALNADVIRIFLRTGIWLLVAGIALIIVIGRSRLEQWVVLMVLFFGSTAAVFLALHSYRLKVARGHSFFLYWDRYIFSELIPLFYILLGLLLAVAYALWGERVIARFRASDSRVRRAVPAIAIAVAAALVVVPTIPQLHLVTKDTYMAGAWEFEQELIAEIPSLETPVLWSASQEGPTDGFFFPNTWMAFAKPLERSYGYTVYGVHGHVNDFAPDFVMTDATLATFAVCAKQPRLLVFETQNGGRPLDERISDPELTIEYIGEKTSSISLLSQPPTNGDWTHANIVVKAWFVTPSASLAASTTCAS
jgi:hypothetical protein